MAAAPKPARSADSVDRVYEAMKVMAADYRFRPGERINEVELAERLGVSRTPVRAALNRLARDGFVTFAPNRGYLARDITPDAVRDLYELRATIEGAAIRLACARASDGDIVRAAQAWERSAARSGGDWERVTQADEAFHLAIAKMSGNARMVTSLESINALIRFFRRIDIESRRRRTSTFDEHTAIIGALTRRDASVAQSLIEAHITMSAEHAVDVTKEGLARIFLRAA